MRRPGIAAFFFLTVLVTWGLQLPGVLSHDARLLPLAVLGIFGPLAAATALTARADGRAGVRALYARLLPTRVHPIWYAIALLLPGALLAALLGLLRLAGHRGDLVLHRGAATLVVGLVVAIAEEVGWRGYALPRLRAHFGAVAGSAILGLVWLVWHVPMFLGQGVPLSLMVPMTLMFVGGSLMFTWLDARTSGSLFIAVLAHLGLHLNNSHAALPGDVVPLLCHSIVFATIGVAVVMLDRRAFPELSRTVRPGVGRRASATS
jgi:membrane protease YdiL (CAAX protease family)